MNSRLGRLNSTLGSRPDLICFSHLRWNFVFQRPQHLMVRFARDRRVYFVEEPIVDDAREAWIQLEMQAGVVVVTPHLPSGLSEPDSAAAQRTMLDRLIAAESITRFVLWYYTPLALRFSDHLEPLRVAYDCMDELSAFKGASSDLPILERQLLRRADVVFTGGQSLFEAKKTAHPNIHPMPSSVDVAHFAAARHAVKEPSDQRNLPGPRLGFFGVLDERLDIALVGGLAEARPDWQLVMIGPVVKIDAGDLPRRSNIHYLGAKTYAELPLYLAGWDVALLPFARNEATRFISPTKTPEYLAAGRPVVSTSIRDVISPYGELGLVAIADTVAETVQACEAALREQGEGRRARADAFLRGMSWDITWSRMSRLLDSPATAADPAQPRAAALASVQPSAAAARA
jgi:UDP-galactopyranose mutase